MTLLFVLPDGISLSALNLQPLHRDVGYFNVNSNTLVSNLWRAVMREYRKSPEVKN